MGLGSIAPMPEMPLEIRRVVLLVPSSGLSLLRAFHAAEIFLSLSSTHAFFYNHFVSVHMAFVRVRRGDSKVVDSRSDWRSLSKNLMVRGAREDDPDAELMVSAIVPNYALTLAPLHLTELKLRPQESAQMCQAPKDIVRRLGGWMEKVFYGANLANTDRTAIMLPDEPSRPMKSKSSTPLLACPAKALSSRCEDDTRFSAVSRGSGAPESPFRQRFKNGTSVFDQSLEVMSQSGRKGGAPLVGRVKLVMVNR